VQIEERREKARVLLRGKIPPKESSGRLGSYEGVFGDGAAGHHLVGQREDVGLRVARDGDRT
jgi:hypothetical protein